MLARKLFFISFLLIIFSCKEDSLKEEQSKNQEKIVTISENYTTKINENLSPEGKKMVENWKEYERMDNLLQNYENYDVNRSLLNSKELAKLAQELKDSVRVDELQIPAVKIRLHVIHNEALRLQDMSSLKKISDEEVTQERSKIFEAFSALNSKINNMVVQEDLNEELKNFIDEVAGDSLRLKDSSIEKDMEEQK
ncbi:MAG: hypothetical protein ABFR05_12295 [Bacteroidota bacterium]